MKLSARVKRVAVLPQLSGTTLGAQSGGPSGYGAVRAAVAVGSNPERNVMQSTVISHFSPELLVLRQIAGPRLPLTATAMLSYRLRQVISSRCPQINRHWLDKTEPVHHAAQRNAAGLALVPLAHVGRRYSDGCLSGMAIIGQRPVSRDELLLKLKDVLFSSRGAPLPVTLKLGKLGVCTVQVVAKGHAGSFFGSTTWCGPSRRWASVTPICLGRPGQLGHTWHQLEQRIAEACQSIGLVRPAVVIASCASLFMGVPTGREMPRLTLAHGGSPMQHVHAVLEFDRPVQGPLLLGAGWSRGYGLCQPLEEDFEERNRRRP